MLLYTVSGICSLILSILCLTVLLPFLIYSTLRYRYTRHKFYFQRRHAIGVDLTIITLYPIIITEAILSLLYAVGLAIQDTWPWSIPYRINASALTILFCICCARTWLLYFDHGYHSALLNQEWAASLNPNASISNFFVRYKQS